MCLESIGNNVVTNLEYNGNAVKESTMEGRWTKEFKDEILKAIAKWFAAPEGRQITKWMAKMGAGSFLNSQPTRSLNNGGSMCGTTICLIVEIVARVWRPVALDADMHG